MSTGKREFCTDLEFGEAAMKEPRGEGGLLRDEYDQENYWAYLYIEYARKLSGGIVHLLRCTTGLYVITCTTHVSRYLLTDKY